jgi:hypothetical protein
MRAFVLGLESGLIPEIFCEAVKKCRDDSGASSDMVKSVIFNQGVNINPFLRKIINQIFSDCVYKSIPFPETIEAINYLKSLDTEIFISSGLPLEYIEKPLFKYDFSNVFGREDGFSPEHIDTIYRVYEPERLFFITGKPQHFMGVNRAKLVCVNTCSCVGADIVIPGPFNKELAEKLAKGA